MAIRVIAPGLATTVQDLGRPGYYHLGIPLSGAMDRFALRAANLLVGNDEDAAGLECVFLGPELEFTSDATVAVAGAELAPRVNGAPRATWTSFAVKAGDLLSFDFLKAGALERFTKLGFGQCARDVAGLSGHVGLGCLVHVGVGDHV